MLLLPSQDLIHGESHFFISFKVIRDGLQRGTQLFRFAKKHPVPHSRLSVGDILFINFVFFFFLLNIEMLFKIHTTYMCVCLYLT